MRGSNFDRPFGERRKTFQPAGVRLWLAKVLDCSAWHLTPPSIFCQKSFAQELLVLYRSAQEIVQRVFENNFLVVEAFDQVFCKIVTKNAATEVPWSLVLSASFTFIYLLAPSPRAVQRQPERQNYWPSARLGVILALLVIEH
jgi:hypothetical protein